MNQLALQVTLLKYILYSVCSLFFHPGSYLLECQEACLFPKKKVHDMLPDWLSLLTLDKKKGKLYKWCLLCAEFIVLLSHPLTSMTGLLCLHMQNARVFAVYRLIEGT